MDREANSEYIVAAYIMDHGMPHMTEGDALRLTHLNYAFALVRDGAVTGHHLRNLGLLAAVRAANPKLKTLFSIGGWGAGNFSEAAATPESRARFTETALAFMTEHDFDGIDVDWEYPCSSAAGISSSPADRQNFTLMIRSLREELDALGAKSGKHYLLTIAAGADQSYVRDTEMDLVQRYLDFVNLMTYDMRGSWSQVSGHHTNLYSPAEDPAGISADKAVHLFVDAGVPKEKIVIGAAFYGRTWSGVVNAGNGLHQQAATTGGSTLDYTTLVGRHTAAEGWTRHWDDTAKAPYLFNGETFVSYDDEESLWHKAQYVKHNGLAGVMFWEYSLDRTHMLVKKLWEELR